MLTRVEEGRWGGGEASEGARRSRSAAFSVDGLQSSESCAHLLLLIHHLRERVQAVSDEGEGSTCSTTTCSREGDDGIHARIHRPTC